MLHIYPQSMKNIKDPFDTKVRNAVRKEVRNAVRNVESNAVLYAVNSKKQILKPLRILVPIVE